MSGAYSWMEDDPDAGLISYVLVVDSEGRGVLSMNGQGHLPISPGKVREILTRPGIVEWTEGRRA